MRILIDTNIFIYREDNHVVPFDLQELLRVFNELGFDPLVHPRSIDDIRRDKDRLRQSISLSKLATYPVLKTPPDYRKDKSFMHACGQAIRPSDDVDNAIIYAVFRNIVNILITEDEAIHKKAAKLNLRESVITIEEALERFRPASQRSIASKPPAVGEDYVYNLDVNDPFFDTLKGDYPRGEFEGWLKKISAEPRKCWVFRNKGRVEALLIYKIEDEPIDASPYLPKKKRLKLCTLKVKRTGYKIGELLMKLSLEYAINNDLEEIYLTHFTKEKDELIELITDYGYILAATKKNREGVYIKDINPSKESLLRLSPSDISNHFWPYYYDGLGVKKFIVPILPKYHDRLFPEQKKVFTLFEAAGEFVIEGNTVKKAYLSKAPIRKVSEGSILLFYRSHDAHGLTSVGVVDKVYYDLQDADAIYRIVKDRTVYTQEEIRSMKPRIIILFMWHYYFPELIELKDLIRKGVLKGAPRTIMETSEEAYQRLFAGGLGNERFAIH
jgi:rRNA-processing protein FCF1